MCTCWAPLMTSRGSGYRHRALRWGTSASHVAAERLLLSRVLIVAVSVCVCVRVGTSAKDWTQQVWAGRVDVMAKGPGAEVKLINPNGAVPATPSLACHSPPPLPTPP